MSLLFAVAFAIVQPTKEPPPKPTAHVERKIEGWTVHVDERLLKGDDEALGTLALKCVESQLHNVALVLPADKVKRLRHVPIWLDRTHGKLVPAQYHPNAGWLTDNGYDRALQKCVHVPDAKYFAAARHQREQPWAMLHELAHAYHDQVLGFDEATVKAAWKKLVDGGKYKSVLHVNGKDRSHYALTNQMEFFAEMTESYFGQNDFYPFNSGELLKAEPEIYAMLKGIWGPIP